MTNTNARQQRFVIHDNIVFTWTFAHLLKIILFCFAFHNRYRNNYQTVESQSLCYLL